MESKWKELPLSQLYDFRSGLSKPRSQFGFGYGFLSFKDVFYNIFVPGKLSELVNSTDQERESCSIKKGDVFLTRTSETIEELGMSCVALKDYESATFNGFTKRLRPKANVNIVPEYAGYFFRSPRFRLEVTAMSSLSTRASLNNEMLGRLKMVLPSPEEQTAIGIILKGFDDKVELYQQMNETLEAIAHAMFKSWFVDFDPVRTKADGRQPAGMDAGTAAHFPDRLVSSELGDIPEGWEVKPLREVLTENNNRIGDADVPAYSSTNDGLQLQSERFKKKLSISNARNKLIHEGDLVFGLSRRVLNFGLMRDPIGCVSPVYKVFSIDKEEVVPDLLERTMRLHPNYYYNAVSASSREGQAISSDGLGRLKFVRPTNAAQQAFYSTTAPFITRIEHGLSEYYTLCALRDTLLPRLISGQIRAKDAEKFVEEHAG